MELSNRVKTTLKQASGWSLICGKRLFDRRFVHWIRDARWDEASVRWDEASVWWDEASVQQTKKTGDKTYKRAGVDLSRCRSLFLALGENQCGYQQTTTSRPLPVWRLGTREALQNSSFQQTRPSTPLLAK